MSKPLHFDISKMQWARDIRYLIHQLTIVFPKEGRPEAMEAFRAAVNRYIDKTIEDLKPKRGKLKRIK